MRSIAAIGMVAALAAQEPVFRLNVHVDLVELHVLVFDSQDRPVSGLKREHFRVTEDQVDQPIETFKSEDQPVSLGLVLDNSRSIEPRKDRLDAAAIAFVERGNPEDETFVVNFDFEARLSQDFTGDISLLRRTLAGIQPYGQTAIYDAMMLAIQHAEQGTHAKKALLLITDGVDNSSKTRFEDLLGAAKRSKAAIYTVGLLSELDGEKAEKDLIALAEAGGGRAFFPENSDQVRQMCERLARDLREQYTIGYRPTNQKRDGRWRSVRVEITPPAGVTKIDAHYRHGYYGPEK